MTQRWATLFSFFRFSLLSTSRFPSRFVPSPPPLALGQRRWASTGMRNVSEGLPKEAKNPGRLSASLLKVP